MRSLALLACLAVAFGAVAAPAMAATVASPEASGDPCCTPGCTLCLCCSHLPQVLVEPWRAETGRESASAADLSGATAPSPPPRDILHVPRSAASR